MYRNHLILLLLWLLAAPLHASEDEYIITAEQWAIPRHGERLLKMPALGKMLNEWQQDENQAVQISYPGGEQGELWLRELQDWLIALGLPSENINAVAGSGGKDIIKLSVLNAGGNN